MYHWVRASRSTITARFSTMNIMIMSALASLAMRWISNSRIAVAMNAADARMLAVGVK